MSRSTFIIIALIGILVVWFGLKDKYDPNRPIYIGAGFLLFVVACLGILGIVK